MKKEYFFGLACAFVALFCDTVIAAGYISESQAGPPLSCRVQIMQSVEGAKLRDGGATRQEIEMTLEYMGDFTKKEAKTIVDRIYVHMKNKTPEQIGKAVRSSCNGR